MSARAGKLQVLLIRSWVEDVRPIRSALLASGLACELTCVDFEAALYAALTRGRYDVAIYDPGTPGLSHDTVLACVRSSRHEMPIVLLCDLDSLGDRVAAALASRSN